MSQEHDEITKLRGTIDELDGQIVNLLNERARQVLKVRRAKTEASLEIFDPERESEIQERLSRLNDGPLSDADLQRVYETLLDVMKTFE